MTQKDKELFLKDLCARLPYGVKVTWDDKHPLTVTPHIYCAIGSEDNIKNLPKLLLRPMSSMTDEEQYICRIKRGEDLAGGVGNESDYLNSIHVDYRGLIEKGLAVEVTEDNNPYKE